MQIICQSHTNGAPHVERKVKTEKVQEFQHAFVEVPKNADFHQPTDVIKDTHTTHGNKEMHVYAKQKNLLIRSAYLNHKTTLTSLQVFS